MAIITINNRAHLPVLRIWEITRRGACVTLEIYSTCQPRHRTLAAAAASSSPSSSSSPVSTLLLSLSTSANCEAHCSAGDANQTHNVYIKRWTMSDGASNRIPFISRFISRFNALPLRVRMLCVLVVPDSCVSDDVTWPKHMRDLFDKIKFSTTAAAASRQPASQPAILSQRENVSQTIPNEIAIRTHSPHINSQIRKLNVLMSCVCVCVSCALRGCVSSVIFFFVFFDSIFPLSPRKFDAISAGIHIPYLLCHWKSYSITGSRTAKTHRNQRWRNDTASTTFNGAVHTLWANHFLGYFFSLRAPLNVWAKWRV